MSSMWLMVFIQLHSNYNNNNNNNEVIPRKLTKYAEKQRQSVFTHLLTGERETERELWIFLNYSQFQKYTVCFSPESLAPLFPLLLALVGISGQQCSVPTWSIISGLASIDYLFHFLVLCISRNFRLYSGHYECFVLETLSSFIFAKQCWCFRLNRQLTWLDSSCNCGGQQLNSFAFTLALSCFGSVSCMCGSAIS